tara:strand:- start:6156 stop:6524 length:369 start_codon:yes stop_codon:yes gene_type:complete
MSQFEYKVVPAPKKGIKAKGIKTAEDRFAHALETAMNTLGANGWEYQRCDTLPSEERSGLTGRVTTFQNMLVFRREIPQLAETDAVADHIAATIAPVADTPVISAKPLDADPARPEPKVAAE